MAETKIINNAIREVALIELGGSHDECLYSQVAALKFQNYKVHLIIDDMLAKRIGKDAGADFYQIISLNIGFWRKWKNLFSIRNYLKKNKIPKAVINTAEGKLIRNLCFLIGNETEITGILHNGRKLLKSGTQKMISLRIKKYFVLNSYIKEALRKEKPDLKVESFYPVFFPRLQVVVLPKEKDEFWICIPGQLEIKRRDYVGLLQVLATNKVLLENKAIKFILLGNGSHVHGNGPEVKKLVQEMGLEAHFIFFDSFISNEVFYSYLSKSDMVMPLIHPETEGFDNYMKYQVSGTYNLAFGFAKPMLMHEDFNKIEDLQLSSWFYKIQEIPLVLEKLLADRELLKQKEKHIRENEKFSLAYQSRKYLDFI